MPTVALLYYSVLGSISPANVLVLPGIRDNRSMQGE